MNFYHRFGTFHETVTVDGTTFSFEEYKSLPKDVREVLREEAVALCVQANQRRSDERKKLTAPVDMECVYLVLDGEAGRVAEGNTYPAAVHNIFSVWEEKVETPWEKFERMVNHFDWYYSYSDDHSVWSAGNSRHKQIMALVEQLGPEARKIYNQKCPWLNEDGTQKKEAV